MSRLRFFILAFFLQRFCALNLDDSQGFCRRYILELKKKTRIDSDVNLGFFLF